MGLDIFMIKPVRKESEEDDHIVLCEVGEEKDSESYKYFSKYCKDAIFTRTSEYYCVEEWLENNPNWELCGWCGSGAMLVWNGEGEMPQTLKGIRGRQVKFDRTLDHGKDFAWWSVNKIFKCVKKTEYAITIDPEVGYQRKGFDDFDFEGEVKNNYGVFCFTKASLQKNLKKVSKEYKEHFKSEFIDRFEKGMFVWFNW